MSAIPGEGFNHRQIQVIAVTATCLALSTVAIVLRLLVRWSSAAIFWWDDCVAVLALVVSWLVNIFVIDGIRYGLGRHSPQVDPINMTPFGVTLYVQQIAWVLSTGLIIFAILLFYVRIFPNKWMRKAVYVLSVWDAAWTLSTLIVMILQCTPVDLIWNRNTQSGKCINADVFYFICGLTSAATVVTVLLLPMPIIWKLQVSRSRKIGLAISFTIGAFACVASIVRLVVLLDINPKDPMYTCTLPALWSCVEVSFGVVSACLPSLTPLFLILIGKRPASSRKHSFSFGRHREGKMRNTEFNRIADATDGVARSQSLELIIRNRNASDDVDAFNGSRGPILVTYQVDQFRDKKADHIPEAEQVGVVADASTWNV